MPPQRRERVVHIVDRTGRERRRCGCEHRGLGDTKPHFLAFHAAHGLCQPDSCQRRVALAFCPEADPQPNQKQDSHCREDASAFTAKDSCRQAFPTFDLGDRSGCTICDNRSRQIPFAVPNHLAKGDHTGSGKEHHGIQLNQVGDDGRVFNRRSRVRAQKSAAVCAEMLDNFQRRHRPHSNHLFCAFNGIHHHIPGKILRHALPYQQQAADNGERKQHAGRDANQIDKEVSDVYPSSCLPGPRMNAMQAA